MFLRLKRYTERNHMKKIILILVIIVFATGIGYMLWNQNMFVSHSAPDQNVVRQFFERNISTLSPEKEVLGGTFYVTDFALNDNYSGVVSYEDGHMAYKAYVTFTTDKTGAISVTSFDIIE